MMRFRLPRVYPITDRKISGLSHQEQVRELVSGGARLIQLREKDAGAGEFYNAVVEAIAFARPKGVRIIVNDRVDIAYAADADGVHLGQTDLSPIQARRLLGTEKIIGYSTHNLEQASLALDLPIDYLAIGPVFGTSTKADPDPVTGLDVIRSVRAIAGELPLVAIGGITNDNASEVFSAGADSIALISSLLSQPGNIAKNLVDFNNFKQF
jgi:thiamine-phosphate pyrophosphorylase